MLQIPLPYIVSISVFLSDTLSKYWVPDQMVNTHSTCSIKRVLEIKTAGVVELLKRRPFKMEGTEKIIFTSNNGVREGTIFSRVCLFRGVGGDLCDLYLDMGPPGPGAKLVRQGCHSTGKTEFGSYFFQTGKHRFLF